jgi:hypothetical protein
MPVDARLRRTLHQLYGDGRKPIAVEFRRQYHALVSEHGAFTAATHPFAVAAVVLYLEFLKDTKAAQEAQDARQTRKGRRPSLSRVASLKKRLGLTSQSYERARAQLREAVKANRPRAQFPWSQPAGVGGAK